MADPPAGSRLPATLWLLAALLAWTAFAIDYVRGRAFDWRIVAAGLFCAAMGVGAWTRARAGNPPAPR